MNQESLQKIKELEYKIRILEEENQSLSEHAEDTLLLNLVSETINSQTANIPLLEHFLERVAILKNIPWVSCCELKELQAIPICSYVLLKEEYKAIKNINLSSELLKELNEGIRVFPVQHYTGISLSISSSSGVFKPEVAMLIPFQTQMIPKGVFLFAGNDSPEKYLSMLLLIQHMVNLVCDRLDRISLWNELEEMNQKLENRVRERTLELSQANKKMSEEIARRKKIEKELIKEKIHAEESDKLKSVFLANMSHEIRTPMNSILGFSSFLSNPGLSSQTREMYIQIIQNSGKSLLKLIDDILDLSKIESNQLVLYPESVPIFPILKEVFEIYLIDKTLITKPAVRFKLSYELPENIEIRMDPERFRQVLNNLLNNAIKFTELGEIEFGCIQSTPTYSNGRDALFFVRDTGCGIKTENQQNVFQRFWKSDDNPDHLHRGAGLGLAISKNLVEKMGGQIWFESVPGKGSCFYFTIPGIFSVQAIPKTIPIQEGPPEELPLIRESPVLIVEDDPYSLLYLKELLSPLGMNLSVAKTGEEALELIRLNRKFKLVLLDIQLPGINGYEVIREIRRLRPHLPVIAQTAYAMEEERKYALELGFSEYLSKPIDFQRLLSILKKSLQEPAN